MYWHSTLSLNCKAGANEMLAWVVFYTLFSFVIETGLNIWMEVYVRLMGLNKAGLGGNDSKDQCKMLNMFKNIRRYALYNEMSICVLP